MNKPDFRITKLLDTLTGGSQRQTLLTFLASREAQYYLRLLGPLADRWDDTPETYESEAQGRDATVNWHFFLGGCDWWITEKDTDPDGEGQRQAYGFASLNSNPPEWGYIDLTEILDWGAEFDLYWTPVTAAEVLGLCVA